MALGFEHPFTCTIAGPTKSGKTVFVQKLLKAAPFYIHPAPSRIVWAYGIKNEKQENRIKLNSNDLIVDFVEGIPSIEIFSPDDNNLLIIDDLMHDAGRSKQIADLFTKGCHHYNISLILILQNLFHQAKSMRDIHTSTNYLVLFNNPRDISQIKWLERQCFPHYSDYLVDAYRKACTKKPYGYLVLDFCQTTPDQYRLVSGIFPPETLKVYTPLNFKK